VTLMITGLYRHRHALRVVGLALLVAGLALALAVGPLPGLALVAGSVLPLALSQPLILAHARSRSGRRVASSNGHQPPADPDELDPR
jgi:hypothetical protein